MPTTPKVPGAPARAADARVPVTTPGALLRAAQIVLAKATVTRRRPPIVGDLSELSSPDFVYDTSELEAVWRRVRHVPADANRMRFVHEPQPDRPTLFYVERDLPFDYDDFVSRVDIARVGLMFRDVLGITTEVLRRDEQGRTTLQLERIAALTQPNYTAFLGKDELDVYKLEQLTYEPDSQRNWMRTVHSPNLSALCDDGFLGFERNPDGTARLVFLACQHFPMPRVMVLTRADRWGWLRRRLTEMAYRRFFGETLDNIVAAYEGRDFRVGRRSSEPNPPRLSPSPAPELVGGAGRAA